MKLLRALINQVKQTIHTLIKKRFDRWLSKRVPSNFEHQLSNRNIFIMPTPFGFVYLFFDILLFLLGTNYQNNIILLFSYLLASLFITVMLHSFYNISQLTLSSPAKQFTFSKQLAYVPIKISAKKAHFDINFYFSRQENITNKTVLHQCNLGESQLLLPYLASHRGIHNLGRVKIFSEYPLGLFITWAMLDFSHQLVVFPQPKKLNNSLNYLSGIDELAQSESTIQTESAGIDDFSELKDYVNGVSQARIAWKQLARGQGKLSKHYQNQTGSLRWLKLSEMPSNHIETKLSYLCFLILEYSKQNVDFGLILDLYPSTANNTTLNNQSLTIKPSIGYHHQQCCLVALAEFTYNVDG